MKISVLLPSLARKALGGHKVVYEYCNYMVQKDDVFVTLYFFPGDTLKKYINSNELRKHILNLYLKFGNPVKWFELNSKIRLRIVTKEKEMDDADIVIATGIETLQPVLSLSKQKGKKIYFIQDFENWKFDDQHVLSTYTNETLNIVVSKWLFNIVKKQVGVEPRLISNNIDTRVFYPMKTMRMEHSVIFHYRSSPHKGGKYAIRVIEKLKEKYPDLSVAVVSSQERPDSLPGWCNFYENIPTQKVAELNNRYQVFMCTSIDEGFGLPGLEAMACGCALVSTSYKGVLEYAIDGKNALLSPPRDIDAMVRNVEKLFEDVNLRNMIAENGIKTGHERSLEKSAQKFEQVLRETLSEV